MKKGIAKSIAFVLAAGLTIGEGGSVMFAAGSDSILVGLGSSSYTMDESPEASYETETETYATEYSSETALAGFSAASAARQGCACS